MTEKLQLRDAVYRLEDNIRHIRTDSRTIREGSTRLPSRKTRLTHCSHWQCRWSNGLPRKHRYAGSFSWPQRS